MIFVGQGERFLPLPNKRLHLTAASAFHWVVQESLKIVFALHLPPRRR
jgi:hypothetical protein